MKKEVRTVRFDIDLNIEAYTFKGVMQKFPNHFHEYYVIGFIENGKRYLSCKNKEYTIETGDLILFNPNDNHTCQQIDGRSLDYRCINIQPEIMSEIVYEITGKKYLPYFNQQVIFQSDLISSLSELHLMIMKEEQDFKKEQVLFFLIRQLIEEYTELALSIEISEPSVEIKTICEFLEENYTKNITLDNLSDLTGLSKYYLLRSFTKQKGISLYSYLETVRINKAKKLLEKCIPPIEVALQTGFNDQSHFSNFFKKFIGLTPKQYMNIFKESNK
ncbi:AraC-type DNA-binding domain-containing protein [Clostridium pasteurianum DSM 525 = ATCC 6013]|uniref:AraC-type DNA-binding domain-containing protein n=1 Tax=Clostridium pasteurianum DSM 525 = ATCC 6013 TaxID=1262449 RepID=A0A0H3J7V8_CLOPA|nr:AraC family transcriptional regulator [Clostridium pasteurianum]AJA49564.1 AraC-type DNA-binding domain-containing protein [Clostridium pasteurianum DSM 525 = ATCC 6013]AJA53552.1 AraC-type DNA-binding domain-containing protein [Clostridium pasteurianum DSM 525 = ATCC 6013]AOZ76718.1 AraC family transcriptional regulator [Clostridium pasteurianum DSM 525 = ATCC 6013]AOZ80515.1 AraC family transcriptional regulator [Clostridium pasteurianum]ELP58920.1 DNA-binding domain-containing protein [C